MAMGKEMVRLYEPCNILICLACKTAVKPGKGIESHFRKQHKLIGNVLQDIIELAGSIPGLCDPATIELPAEGSLAINWLPVLCAYRCTVCQHLTVNKKNILAHHRSAGHETTTATAWELVNVQTFGRQRYARYWTVQIATGNDDNDAYCLSGGHKAVVDAVRDCEKALASEAEEKRQRVQGEGGIDVDSRFVRFMRWASHLESKDKTRLRMAGMGPMTASAEVRERKDEAVQENRRLRLLCTSFHRELRRCMERIAQVPRDTLKWLASVDPSKPAAEPFGLKQEQDTMDWYVSCFQRYLCYCVRIRLLGRKQAWEVHAIVLSREQWAKLGAVVEELDSAAEHGAAEEEAGEAVRTPLERAIFEFCISSLKQKLYGEVYVNPLLHFTSVLALSCSTGGWLPCHTFTRFLAAMMWCGRILMLEHVFAPFDRDAADRDTGSRAGSIDTGSDLDWEYEDDLDAKAEAVQQFEASYREWMADGTYTPFSVIINWMAYGRAYRNREGGLPRLAWLSDHRTISFHGEHICVGDFQEMGREAVREAEELLDELAGGQWAKIRKTIDLRAIVDSFVFEGAGKSFATNPKNKWLRPGAAMLAELVGGQLWRPVRSGTGAIRYQCRRRAAEEYLQRLRRFRCVFFACTHIWAGQPGRGPETATMKHCDIEQLARNVYVLDGQVMLVTDRDKLASRRGKGRKVARFLPEHLSRVMVAYIAWVLPFENVLYRLSGIRGPSEDLDAWLWKDAGKRGLWDTEVLSRQLGRLSTAHTGVELSVSSYRHLAIEFGRRIRGIVVQQVELDGISRDDADTYLDPTTGEPREAPRLEYIWDLQATHSSVMARNHYALTVLFPEQLQPEMVANYREISRLWHDFLSLSHGNFTRKRAQAGDSTGLPASKRQQRDAGKHVTDKGRRRAGLTPDIDAGLRALFGKEAQWKTAEQREGMERIMGLRDGGIRSEQLILVLPTGGGKSIFFMLPSAVEDVGLASGPTSIVVVPFIALMEDLAERARGFGIDCVSWRPRAEEGDSEKKERDARLVIVSADMAVCAEFTSYVESIRRRDQLRRIFFDECHTAVTDVGYRARLGQLMGLHRFGCPMVMLTATLPVSMEGWFREHMLCSDAVIMRASAAKLNIRYRVETTAKAGQAAVTDKVAEVMGRLEQRMAAGKKGVVYCRSVGDCERLADRAGCRAYHSKLAVDVRRDMLQDWAEGRGGVRWITATSGLGTGVDIKGIVAVVHMRQPYGLVDFIQQTGRGGRREGEVVDSVIVTDGRPVWYDEFSGDVDQLNREAVEQFIAETGRCRRIRLGLFMDGTAHECEELGGELCDYCSQGRLGSDSVAGNVAGDITGNITSRHGNVAGNTEDGTEDDVENNKKDDTEDGMEDDMEDDTEHGKTTDIGEDTDEDESTDQEVTARGDNRLKEHQRQQSRTLDMLHNWLDEVRGSGSCSVCYVKWHIHGRRGEQRMMYRHGRGQCGYLPQKSFNAWRIPLRFGEFRCCWECGLPYEWCEQARTEGYCKYRDCMLPVVMMAKKSGTVRRLVEEMFEVDAMDDDKYRAWLVRSRWLYGQDMTNALAVWGAIVEVVCNSKAEE